MKTKWFQIFVCHYMGIILLLQKLLTRVLQQIMRIFVKSVLPNLLNFLGFQPFLPSLLAKHIKKIKDIFNVYCLMPLWYASENILRILLPVICNWWCKENLSNYFILYHYFLQVVFMQLVSKCKLVNGGFGDSWIQIFHVT